MMPLLASGIPGSVVGAIIAGAVALFVLAVNTIVAAQREQRSRRRDIYASAFAAVMAYVEFPYVVRRRKGGEAEVAAEERVRISEELREVQQQLAYYGAWIRTESPRVAAAYARLVSETRRIAGRRINEAWRLDPMTTDEGMNMPDLGLAELDASKDAYLEEVACHLRWFRRAISYLRRA